MLTRASAHDSWTHGRRLGYQGFVHPLSYDAHRFVGHCCGRRVSLWSFKREAVSRAEARSWTYNAGSCSGGFDFAVRRNGTGEKLAVRCPASLLETTAVLPPPLTTGLTLVLDRVRVVYGSGSAAHAALADVTLRIEQGEVVGLLGPNGAGKSTAFGLMAGRDAPSEGRVLLGGLHGSATWEDVTMIPLEQRARLGIAYVPQESSIFRGLTVLQNVLLPLECRGLPRARRESRAAELLSQFGLTSLAQVPGRALSGGERRRCELARAIASGPNGAAPRLLLVDEPFAGVDPLAVVMLQKLLMGLRESEGVGLLITDHNAPPTLAICDRAYMLLSGRIMAEGTPEALATDEAVRRFYLGDSCTAEQLKTLRAQVAAR